MTEMELLTWLCIIGICVAGVMNLRHTESTLVIRQDFRDKLDKAQADKYQSRIGVVYLLAGVLAGVVNLFADGKIYMVGMLAAVLVLVLGSVLCNRKFRPQEKK